MGANHSNSHDHAEFWRENQTTPTSRHKSAIHPSDGGHRKKFKAKPNPPVQVSISAVTHSSVRFSWLPPRSDHGHPVIAYTIEACRPNKHGGKRWQVLTKNCQSTSYEAKHLESDTTYVFKVRAENVFGTGKPSPPSERVTTKVFEMSSDLNCYLSSTNANAAGAATMSPASPGYNYQTMTSPYATLTSSCSMDFDQVGASRASSDMHVAGGRSTSTSGDYPHGSQVYPSSYQSLKRRHSFNVQLDGGVTSILNHSDVFLNSSFSSSTSTITNNNGNNRRMSQGNGLDAESKTLSLNRGMGHRSSMQPNGGRKVSLSAFLPGAKAQSMNRLRESRNSLRSGAVGGSSSDFNGNTVTKTALLSLNRDFKRDNPRNNLASASSSSDVISSLSSNSKEENRRSRGSRCSLLSSQSDATVSNSHDGSRLSDYSSSMDNLDSTDFGDSPVPTNSSSISSNGNNNMNSFKVNLFSSLEDIVDQFSKTPTDRTLNETCDDDDDDEISKIKQELRNIELTDEKLRSQAQDTKPDLQFLTSPNRFNQNYYDILEDPWEKFPPIPESIMAAPFCDDIKIALYAKNITDDVTNGYHGSGDNLDEGNHDFRTLRSVLQSDQTIVRPTRPYSDMVGVVVGEAGEARTLTRGKLTTIEDADEDEDPVRVTSL